ncbi:serine/threonine-protein phosphatase [Frankia sp. AgB32]|nr:SpoIIE family protein phosphatase [Frankia sp. AgB32]MCK9893954.1 serine/threonine-protein phosphatase [Frankia sp. AgB32]
MLREALGEVAALSDMNEMFATAFVAVVDPGSGQLRYASAGHPAPVLIPGSGDPDGAARTLPVSGPVLCDLFAGRRLWSTRSVTLGPGDRLRVHPRRHHRGPRRARPAVRDRSDARGIPHPEAKHNGTKVLSPGIVGRPRPSRRWTVPTEPAGEN